MWCLKQLLSLWAFFNSLLFMEAVGNNDTTWSSESIIDILRLENEVLKYTLGNQNLTLENILQKLQILEDKFDKVLEMADLFVTSQHDAFDPSIEVNDGVTTMSPLNDRSVERQRMDKRIELIRWELQKKLAGKQELFITDILEKSEPKICKLNAYKKLICSGFALSKMCADGNALNCVNNKCRVRNSIYGDESFWVSCDGDWTVIQRRINGSVSFYRNYMEYQRGFGDIDGEFWIGLDKLHSLTTIMGPVELLIQLKDFDNVYRYAKYESFSVGNSSTKYILSDPRPYSGNAGDSLSIYRNEKFSTNDSDNDNKSNINCAVELQGGWWYYNCLDNSDISNLNGIYYSTGISPDDKGTGIYWKTFRGKKISMKLVQMMIRPKKK